MFPELLEDAAVQSLFAPVLRHVSDNYDLTFEPNQRYPVSHRNTSTPSQNKTLN